MVPTFALWAYFSPETYLPVTSIIATVIGVVMMFGRNSLSFLLGCLRLAGKSRSRPRATALRGPHFRSADEVEAHADESVADDA